MAESKPHVTWDEETIALHDQDRGTRMKIEEPKTPYHYYGSDDEGSHAAAEGVASPARSLSGKENEPSIEWNELQVKLEEVQDRKKSEWDSSDDEESRSFAARDAEGKKIVKDPKFAEKRKQHYNEFERVKMWRQSHPDEDDEVEEEEDESKQIAKSEGVQKPAST
ncbi:hypothetical protein Poli38472_011945 [Pythium oligandrum]|uniref:Protein phosphatase inhibitor 2 n=1 Tax=Pythium oligandrum TaxID=41045 RepID=A0A8K1CPF5_PYTOL|nr:hypothetical protein Poli38472_011945 [Pythium oligandrum]|eukprot:TMW66829.1 hypothetical protein Poli38472_011945 [Pythium oligandrum]